MKIGVAIPCYIGHIDKLMILLDSIEKQTVLPDKVIVSCSSVGNYDNDNDNDNDNDDNIKIKINITKFSFPLEIITCPEKKNPAQNRNIAATNLFDKDKVDYVTFFDADDIMHPQRIEILSKIITENNSEFILHNFFCNGEVDMSQGFPRIDNISIRNNMLIPAPSGCATHTYGYNDSIDRIHHSQVTVDQNLFYKVKFPEDVMYEDSVFCNKCLHIENLKTTYIVNKLSYYVPCLSWMKFDN